MNILYCGDSAIIDGLIISILSILKNTDRILHIYVLTFKYKGYKELDKKQIDYLDKLVKNKNKDNFCILMDITKEVNTCIPKANISTKFTPYCMLRLYIDMLDLPDKILYLDNDTVILKSIDEFYDTNMDTFEIAGVLDYYGSRFFRKKIKTKDYINSGVLLINLNMVKKTKLFEKSRKMIRHKKMLLPDQSAINSLSKHKLILDRKFNEQKTIRKDTVIRHYCSTFIFKPRFKVQTIKPWNIDALHNTLHDHEFDDILNEYLIIKGDI